MSTGFLDGNFAPVRDEVTDTGLVVTGHIPDYLDGRYIRNGPNALGEIDPDAYEWFAAPGMVHGLRLRDGRVEWYRNRSVRTREVCKALGEKPRGGPIHAGIDYPMHTNVIGSGGRTFAISEAGPNPYELSFELDTVGSCDFDGTLPGGGGYVSHPHCDPVTGEWHGVSYWAGRSKRAYYTVLGTDARIRKVVEIPTSGPVAMHDFALTENYVIVFDLPLLIDSDILLSGFPTPLRQPLSRLGRRLLRTGYVPDPLAATVLSQTQPNSLQRLPLRWDPTHQARLGVLPREGTTEDLRWFDIDQCHVWHTLNAYEEDGTIVVDFVGYPKMYDTDRSWPNPEDGNPTLDRWTIDLTAGKVRTDRLDDRPQEFPQVNPAVVGRRHRYGFTVGAQKLDTAEQTGLVAGSDTVFKHDLTGTATIARHLGEGRSASEFVFVPSGPNAAEDDGVAMGYVYNRATDTSDLVILDGQTLETVGVVHLPTRVPFGFHGNWLPS